MSAPEGDPLDGPETLDLSQDEDLALYCAYVPEWPTLADGLDLSTEEDQAEFSERVQRAWDQAMAARKQELDRVQDQT